MGARRPLVEIPGRLRRLLERDAGGTLRQPAVAVRQERWIPRLGPHANVVATLPSELNRDRVRELVVAAAPSQTGAIAGFIATQIWGYGTTGYGPTRLATALADPGLPDALQAARDRLNAGDPVGAFRVLCVEHRISHVGMAFGSKYLYFADPHRRALILDQIIRDWLAKHAHVRLAGRRDDREYAVWLLVAEEWASALGVLPEMLEVTIFNDGLPEGSSWRLVERTPTTTGARSQNRRTCADAIARVLETAPAGMRAADIARQINGRALYRRRDGRPLPAYQVNSIAHGSPGRFSISAGVITLTGPPAPPSKSRVPPTPAAVTPRQRTQRASTVILLGCVKQKLDHRAPAMDLYRSQLWKARRTYAESSRLPWLILSAKHGLLDPDATIAPYDVALRSLSVAERHRWGEHVVRALEQRFVSLRDLTFEVHAGEPYRRAIEPGLTELGARIDAPLAHLSIGRQPAWYRAHNRRTR